MSAASTPCTLDQAIRLNNDGIVHALNGEDDRAIASFAKSLGMFKQLLTQEEEVDQTMSDDTPRSTSQLHSTSHALPQLKNSGFFLFNQVFSLAHSDTIRAGDNHIYCSVIILNLAVLHHQKALRCDSVARRSDALHKAERFYDMVTTILSNEEYGAQVQPTGVLARLAALNNLAHIRMEKGDFGASGHCFQMLAYLVSLAQVEEACIFDEDDLEGMMLNVLMANRQSVAPAA